MRGCWTALVTPFKEDGSLDEEGLRVNLKFQQESGIDGVVALGTTGESPTVTEEEQERIVAICKKELKIPLVVGTGANCTATTIKKTKWAEKMGADGALIVAPYYNRPTQEGLFRHYMAVADAVSIPIMVYNIAGRTGVNIATETLKRMSVHPNIKGVKDASGDINQMGDVLAAIPHFIVLSGDDKLTLPLRALGGHGVISVVANLVPSLMHELVHGDLKRAKEIHFELLPLFKASMMETNPIPIKTLMRLAGMPSGSCRMPLTDASVEILGALEKLLLAAV